MAKAHILADAVAYVLQATHLSPEELKKVVETSRGYSGEDYNKWLTAQLIFIAEENEILHTQLQADWSKIVLDAMDLMEPGKSAPWVQRWIPEGAVNVNFGGSAGNPADLDLWLGPVDYLGIPLFSKAAGLPVEEGTLSLVASLESSPIRGEARQGGLRSLGKQYGFKAVSEGDLLLIRAINLAETRPEEVVTFTTVSSVDFWHSVDEPLLGYFLSIFNQQREVEVSAHELDENDLTGREFLLIQFDSVGGDSNHIYSRETGRVYSACKKDISLEDPTEVLLFYSAISLAHEVAHSTEGILWYPINGVSEWNTFLAQCLPLGIVSGFSVPAEMSERLQDYLSVEAKDVMKYRQYADSEDPQYREMAERSIRQLSKKVLERLPFFQNQV